MGIFRNFFDGMINSRMTSARYEIAQYIKRETSTNYSIEQIQGLLQEGKSYEEVVEQVI